MTGNQMKQVNTNQMSIFNQTDLDIKILHSWRDISPVAGSKEYSAVSAEAKSL
jgi:hypothetical protein